MSPKELKEFARNAGELMKEQDRQAQAKKDAEPIGAPADAPKEPSSEPGRKQSVAELYRKAGFRELPPSGKGYVIPTGKRPASKR